MRYVIVLIALLLAACGGRIAGPSSPAAPSSVTATSGQFRSEATPARVAAGGTVRVALTVSGPMDYEVGCVQTLHIWAVDAQGSQVWAEPVPAIMCMAFGHKLLAAGETATFTADWTTSSTLKPGVYTVHGLFLTLLPPGVGARVRENLPPLTVEITQ